jgi:XapX domain-containing protein
MNARLLYGYLLAFVIGAMCRISGIPVPTPPALIGALIVTAMTLGYLFADKYLGNRNHEHRDNCGGSVG